MCWWYALDSTRQMQFMVGNALFCPCWELQRMATCYVIEIVKHALLSGRNQRKPQSCLRKVESKTTTSWRSSVLMRTLTKASVSGCQHLLKVISMMISLSLWMQQHLSISPSMSQISDCLLLPWNWAGRTCLTVPTGHLCRSSNRRES